MPAVSFDAVTCSQSAHSAGTTSFSWGIACSGCTHLQCYGYFYMLETATAMVVESHQSLGRLQRCHAIRCKRKARLPTSYKLPLTQFPITRKNWGQTLFYSVTATTTAVIRYLPLVSPSPNLLVQCSVVGRKLRKYNLRQKGFTISKNIV